jgi:hypothetical protein
LSVVEDAGIDGGANGAVEIGRGHDDEGIAAAQFEHGFLDLAAGLRGHLGAGGLAAGERDGLDARVVDDACDLPGADQQGLEHVVGEAGAADDLLDLERALRHVGSMLQEAHVAGYQGRSSEAEDLPEGKVPGHHGEQRADGLVAQITDGEAGGDCVVGQQLLAVFGVIAAGQRALGGFGTRGGDGLAHFERHDAAQAILFLFQDACGGMEALGAAAGVGIAETLVGGIGARQLLFEPGIGQRIESTNGLPGGGVYGSDHHDHCRSAVARAC